MYRLLLAFAFTVAIGVTTVNAKSAHVFSLDESPARFMRASGNMTMATMKEFPMLKSMSIRHLTLTKFGIREPHWHVNANELVYCLRGSALVTMFGNDGQPSSFTITKGEMFYVPAGFIHHIENMDETKENSVAEFILVLSHDLPEDICLSSAVSTLSDAVLGNTFQLPMNAWKDMMRRTEPTVIGTRESSTSVRSQSIDQYPNQYKFDIESTSSLINTAEGSIKAAVQRVWPMLENMAMVVLRLSTMGMREPHWHPDTAEMGYVVRGRARMTILMPGKEQRVETFKLKPGDVYFVPRGYSHVIENIGDEEMMFLVFFDQSSPNDIGFTGTFSAFSREVLASALQCPMNKLPEFPFYPKDLHIVKRMHPIEA